jgi:uncharacterized membrane protein
MSPAHLHLFLNHVPVMGMVMGIGLLAYAVLQRDDRLARVCLGMFAVLAAFALATFLSGELAEGAAEGLAGVPQSRVERHEAAARLATLALGFLGVLSLAVLLRFRTRALPRQAAVLLLAAAVVPAVMIVRTASLGRMIRESEIRAEVVAAPPARAGEGEGRPGQGTIYSSGSGRR